MKRENFSSRLGFILISAGCAIGLGNVWRFPYIVGQYGGAAFVLIYLAFLIMLGLPIMVMELAVGRGSQASAATSFDKLEPKGKKYMIISMGNGDYVRSAGLMGGDLNSNDISNRFVIVDGIDYKSSSASRELVYMEV